MHIWFVFGFFCHRHYHSTCFILYMCKYSPRVAKSKVSGVVHFDRECQVAKQTDLLTLRRSLSYARSPKSSRGCRDGGEKRRQSVTHQTPAKGQVPRRTAPPPGRVGGGCDGALPTKPAAHSFVHLSPESVPGQWGMGQCDLKFPLLANDCRSLV